MKIEVTPEELQLLLDGLDEKHNSYASSGAEALPELNAINRLYNRLSDLEEQQIGNSPAMGLIDRRLEVYEATLRQKVEAKIQASVLEYKALLLAESKQQRHPAIPRAARTLHTERGIGLER